MCLGSKTRSQAGGVGGGQGAQKSSLSKVWIEEGMRTLARRFQAEGTAGGGDLEVPGVLWLEGRAAVFSAFSLRKA